jgi:hypothetical protein
MPDKIADFKVFKGIKDTNHFELDQCDERARLEYRMKVVIRLLENRCMCFIQKQLDKVFFESACFKIVFELLDLTRRIGRIKRVLAFIHTKAMLFVCRYLCYKNGFRIFLFRSI